MNIAVLSGGRGTVLNRTHISRLEGTVREMRLVSTVVHNLPLDQVLAHEHSVLGSYDRVFYLLGPEDTHIFQTEVPFNNRTKIEAILPSLLEDQWPGELDDLAIQFDVEETDAGFVATAVGLLNEELDAIKTMFESADVPIDAIYPSLLSFASSGSCSHVVIGTTVIAIQTQDNPEWVIVPLPSSVESYIELPNPEADSAPDEFALDVDDDTDTDDTPAVITMHPGWTITAMDNPVLQHAQRWLHNLALGGSTVGTTHWHILDGNIDESVTTELIQQYTEEDNSTGDETVVPPLAEVDSPPEAHGDTNDAPSFVQNDSSVEEPDEGLVVESPAPQLSLLTSAAIDIVRGSRYNYVKGRSGNVSLSALGDIQLRTWLSTAAIILLLLSASIVSLQAKRSEATQLRQFAKVVFKRTFPNERPGRKLVKQANTLAGLGSEEAEQKRSRPALPTIKDIQESMPAANIELHEIEGLGANWSVDGNCADFGCVDSFKAKLETLDWVDSVQLNSAKQTIKKDAVKFSITIKEASS